jgi:hypothetical protein
MISVADSRTIQMRVEEHGLKHQSDYAAGNGLDPVLVFDNRWVTSVCADFPALLCCFAFALRYGRISLSGWGEWGCCGKRA